MIKIVKCSDSLYWYKDQVGCSFNLIPHRNSDDDEYYWVVDKDKRINIVNKKDAIKD